MKLKKIADDQIHECHHCDEPAIAEADEQCPACKKKMYFCGHCATKVVIMDGLSQVMDGIIEKTKDPTTKGGHFEVDMRIQAGLAGIKPSETIH